MKALRDVKAECTASSNSNINVSIHKVDVSRPEDIERFVEEVLQQTSSVDLLFNNAGIVIPKAFDRMSKQEFDKVMAVNVNGVVNCTRSFWPLLMSATPNPVAVVNTSSIAGLPQAAGNSTACATSKYTVRGFTSRHDASIIAPHIRCVCTSECDQDGDSEKELNPNELAIDS